MFEPLSPTESPLPSLRAHRRQFVVGPKAFRAREDWQCRQLGKSMWVSHCPDLRNGWAKDTDGSIWALLGLAVQTSEEKPDPLAEIAHTPKSRVPDLYSSWAGRWLLAGADSLHVDAAALLGCFYGEDEQGRTWASSSSALLASLVPAGATDPRTLRYERGLSWFPPPRSRFARIRRVLPSQVLEMSSGNVRPRPLMPEIVPSIGLDQGLELLRRSLVTTIRQLPRGDQPLWMSLSAGGDSRLIFAMAHCAGIPLVTFTRIARRMSLADRLLPPRLARELGYDHVVFRSGTAPAPGRTALINQHCAGHVSEGDALPLLQGVLDILAGISIGGQCFGVGKAKARNLSETVTDPEGVAREIACSQKEPRNSTATAAIGEWLKWVALTPQASLDWRDRYYIEQRLAGWQSSKEQVYDLRTHERFPVINCARNYALMLSLPAVWRREGRYQAELIRRTVPSLMKHAINPDDWHFGIGPALADIVGKSRGDPLYPARRIVSGLRRLYRPRYGH